MKAKRHECDKCRNFIDPVFKTFEDKESWTVKVKAKCKLGKRVMFRLPTDMFRENYGYFRYCNEFKTK
jgi:hypothetical protein